MVTDESDYDVTIIVKDAVIDYCDVKLYVFLIILNDILYLIYLNSSMLIKNI